MSTLALINAISADSVTMATDQADVVIKQAALDGATAKVAADGTTVTADDTALSTALSASGPRFVPQSDGSVWVYQAAADPPGFTILKVLPAD